MGTKARRIGGDWVESADPKSGKVYYANLKTGESSWTIPDEVKRFQEQSAAKQKAAAAAEKDKKAAAAAMKKAGSKAAAAQDQWLERQDPKTGRTYYFNPFLKQTSWEKPDESITTGSDDPDRGKGAWVARIDPRTNRTYYYNTVTRMTSWVNPDEEEQKREDAARQKAEDAAKPKRTSTRASAVSMLSRKSKRVSAQPEVHDEPAFQGTGPAPPTNRTSARTSVRLGEIGAPAAGSRLSMADIARLKRAEKTEREDEDKPAAPEEVKTAPLEDRFAKLRALRERTTKADEQPEEEEEQRQIVLEDLTANAMAEAGGFDLKMSTYGEQYFQLKRKGFGKKPTTLEKILSWKGERIKTSLHPLNDPALVHDAILAFTNILAYMGDKSSRNPIANAQKVFKVTVGAPEDLHDEVYCQLIKQTTNNPDATSCMRGWELMAMSAGLFPPSAKLEKYLMSYVRRNAESQPYPGVGKLAEYALLRMSRSIELGARSETPTEVEIAAVRNVTPVSLRVSLLDGQVITCDAESFTTIADLNEALAKQLKIKDPTPFSLFEVNNLDEERALEDEDRALDVISYWDRERRARRGRHQPSFQFVYKMRLFFDIKEDDTHAIEVAYHQSVFDVCDSRYPITEEDAFRLAALMAQERFGDFVMDDEDKFGDELPSFLPAKYFDKDIAGELRQEIEAIWKLLKGYDSFEAMCNYLDYVKSWKLYGCAFFFVEPQQRDYPPDCVLAVGARGVILLDPVSKEIICDWPYSEVVTWGHSSIAFVLVVGNLIRSTKVFLKTDQGAEVNRLVHAYVNRLAEN